MPPLRLLLMRIRGWAHVLHNLWTGNEVEVGYCQMLEVTHRDESSPDFSFISYKSPQITLSNRDS